MSDIFTKFENMGQAQVELIFPKLVEKIKEDPINNFIKAKGFIDFSPSPTQEVILKIIFNYKLNSVIKKEVKLEDLDEDNKFILKDQYLTETEIYEFLTGKPYEFSESTKNMINLICGRRSGKTTLTAMIAIYTAIVNNWTPYLHKTPFATVLILSHSREFSDEVLDITRKMITSSPILSKLINKSRKNTASTMNLRTPWFKEGKKKYSQVQIKVGAASSKTTRGIAACMVMCDEIAYWNLDDRLQETDEKILKAVRPALKQFGDLAMLVKLSSPSIKQGILYEEYKKWSEDDLPESYVVFKAPTWMMNPTIPSKEFLIEWELDKEGFNVEYRSNFADSLSNFILPEYIDMAVLKGVTFKPPEPNKSKVVYKASIDAAFKADRFTFSVVGHLEKRISQYISMGWEGTREKPISAHRVAEYVAKVCKEYGINEVYADQFAFQPLREIFEKYGVNLIERTFSPTFKKQIYYNIKRLIHSQQLDLLDNPKQTKEMKELIVEQTATGNIKIGHPPGGFDDFCDSLATATFVAVEQEGNIETDMEVSGSKKDYGVVTDTNGVCFNAPPAEMLAESYGNEINDNTDAFYTDPETGKLRPITDLDEDDEDDGFNCII